MGVNVHVYGVWGIKIAWNDLLNAAYEEIYEIYDNPQAPFALFDGLSGEYIVLGHKLFNSGNAYNGFSYGDSEVILSVDALAQLEADYKAQFKRMLPEFSHLMNTPFQIIMITHWT